MPSFGSHSYPLIWKWHTTIPWGMLPSCAFATASTGFTVYFVTRGVLLIQVVGAHMALTLLSTKCLLSITGLVVKFLCPWSGIYSAWSSRCFFSVWRLKNSKCGLCSEYLLLLLCFKFIASFLFWMSQSAQIFNTSVTGNLLCQLGYTYKVTLTVAYQAVTVWNILWCQLFWTNYWAGI